MSAAAPGGSAVSGGWRRAGHAAWRRIGEETVVVDLAAKRLLALDAAGGWLWHALEAVGDWRREASRLAAGDAGVERAIGALLAELAALGLVVPASGDAAGDGDAVAVAAGDPPSPFPPPRVLWREPIPQVAATCAFLPAMSPLCNQAPTS